MLSDLRKQIPNDLVFDYFSLIIHPNKKNLTFIDSEKYLQLLNSDYLFKYILIQL